MKKIFVLLFVCVFLFGTLLYGFAKPQINEQKWIISGAGRTIYLLKLDGSDREVLFENVADEKSHIEVLTNSYNGKIILCKVVSMAKFSYWLVDLDQNEQYPIIEDLKFRPSNTILSKDGGLASFTTSEKVGMKIWIYDVKAKVLKEFGESVSDGIVRFVRFSYNGKFALYSKMKGTNRKYYSILCLRDFEKNRDYELTTREDGDFDIGEFYFDNENILLTRILPDEDYNSLWDFNIRTKRFTYVMQITEEFISAISISRDGNSIALCSYNPAKPGKNFFWTMNKKGAYNLTYINDIPSGMIGLRISHDGKYLLYSTENSPTYISNMDGTFNEELSDLVTLPNLKDAMWYNHPPYPPLVKARALENANEITWESAIPGTYPISGYKVYRSPFPAKNYVLLFSTSSTENEYMDSQGSMSENYYYLVRAFDEDGTESIPSNEVLVDKSPPRILFTSPSPGTWFKTSQVLIEGIGEDLESGVDRVLINGVLSNLNKNGTFSLTSSLQTEGENIITGIIYDKSNNSSQANLLINLDTLPPQINTTSPLMRGFTNLIDFDMSFTVLDGGSGVKKVTLNEEMLEPKTTNQYSHSLKLTEGRNNFHITAEDAVGNHSETTSYIDLDSTPPLIELTFPQDKTELYTVDTSARGKITESGSGLESLTWNKKDIPFETDGSFLIPIHILPGNNVFTLIATDKVGNKAQKMIQVKGVQKIIVQLTIGSTSIVVNNKESKIDAPPFIQEESKRTMVPARFVVEPIGGSIAFDTANQKVTILREENRIELWIGKNMAIVNGKYVAIDSIPSLSPLIVEGRTFLPLRFVADNIGFKVSWDPLLHQIKLVFPKNDLN